LVDVTTVVSLLIGVAGVMFGVYQWRQQRGRTRVQIDEAQGRLILRVVVDAPAPIHVNGILYTIRARGRLRRLLSWRHDYNYSGKPSLRKKLHAIWRFRDMDVAMGRLTSVGEGATARERSPEWYPIEGEELPATVLGYDDASWTLWGANFQPLLRDAQSRWKRPKLQFRVVVSGHPRRVVRSRPILLDHLALLDPAEATWIEAADGLPQVGIGRTDGPL
jgi:hypothetical protein